MAKSAVQRCIARIAHSFDWSDNGFPIARHEAIGARCQGWLTLQIYSDLGEITCNACDTIIRNVPAQQLAAVRSALRSWISLGQTFS